MRASALLQDHRVSAWLAYAVAGHGYKFVLQHFEPLLFFDPPCLQLGQVMFQCRNGLGLR